MTERGFITSVLTAVTTALVIKMSLDYMRINRCERETGMQCKMMAFPTDFDRIMEILTKTVAAE